MSILSHDVANNDGVKGSSKCKDKFDATLIKIQA